MSYEEQQKCICAAAYCGSVALIQLHLDNGVDVNKCNLNEEFPLYWALKSYKIEPVKLLIENGADVTKCSKSGISLFQHALLMGKLQQAEVFLKNGAVATSHPESIKLKTSKNTIDFLINRASDFNIPETNFPTVLYFAIMHDEEMALEILNKNDTTSLDINARHPLSYTLLHTAADCCSLRIVEKLVKSGAKVNVLDSDKVTPLYEAVQQESFEIMRFLLDNGASLKPIYGICQFVPLHTAAALRRLDMVKLLVERGADVNEKNAWGRAPLDYACDSSERYETEDVDEDTNEGVGENEYEDQGKDDDYDGDEDERKEIIIFLRNHGANVNLQDTKGRTALHSACELKDRQFVECILVSNLQNKSMCDQNCIFFHPLCNKAWNVTEFLPTSKKLNDESSFCLLKASTIFAHLRYALEILEGTDVNIQDKNCRTAMHIAVRNGCSEIVQNLMIHQADVNLTDDKGNSALNLALKFYNKNPQPSNLTAAKHITEIIAIRESNGDVNKEDLKLVKNCLLLDHYKQCRMEIMNMKIKKITEETFIPFYDFLEKDTEKLAKLTKNRSILLSLKSGNYKKQFPIYGNLLERCVNLAELRQMILEVSGLVFKHVIKKYSEQPKFVIEDILSYLGNGELLHFSMSVTSSR